VGLRSERVDDAVGVVAGGLEGLAEPAAQVGGKIR
jgi:hypothetical protein